MRIRDGALGRLRGDRGSSLAEFAMISILLIFLLFAVLQVAAVFYVRSVAGAAAADAARYGANADVDSAAAAVRATALIGSGLGAGAASQLACTSGEVADGTSGLATERVRCAGHLRSVFLPLGAFVAIEVSAQSLKEVPR
jgi:Flp pilus assembly protein TadG